MRVIPPPPSAATATPGRGPIPPLRGGAGLRFLLARRGGFALVLLWVTLLGITLARPGQPAQADNTPSAHTSPSGSARAVPGELSDQGAAWIARWEGFSARPYNDPAGHCTIGYGTLLHLGGCRPRDHARWGSISRAQGLAMLQREARSAGQTVQQAVTVPLTVAQQDMLISFTYNCGAAALRRSTLLRLLQAGGYQAAADQLLRWDWAGGQRLAGLSRRRAGERAIFLHGYSAEPV